MNPNDERRTNSRVDTGRRSFLKVPLVAGATGALLYAGYSRDAQTEEEKSSQPADTSQKKVIDEYDPANIKLAHRISSGIAEKDLLFFDVKAQ